MKKGPLVWGPFFGVCGSGGVLLSHTLAGAVPSALVGLAAGFGMGPGVSPPLWPPDHNYSTQLHQPIPRCGGGVVCRESHSGRGHAVGAGFGGVWFVCLVGKSSAY